VLGSPALNLNRHHVTTSGEWEYLWTQCIEKHAFAYSRGTCIRMLACLTESSAESI
jgi:hypothetical protein